jgi:hypothetical protein
MIELLPDLSDQVVGLLASGQVTAHDYESVVIPAIESKLQAHGSVRVLYQLGPAFSGFTVGAMWDDAKLGMMHLKAWDKIAVVTDSDSMRGAIGVFRFAIPCPVKVFSNAQYAEAAAWVAA